mgnify:CR=1 FL=1
MEQFDITTGNHLRTLDNPNVFGTTNNDNFGKSLSSSGNYLAVGTADEDSSLGNGRGVVYVYDVTDGSLVYTASNPTPETYDFMGKPVSMSGGTLLTVAKQGDPAEAYVWTAPLL